MANTHSAFIGLMQRAKNVKRWPLMAQFQDEMLSTHIYEASVVAHMLGAIACDVFGEDINPDRVAAMAIFRSSSSALVFVFSSEAVCLSSVMSIDRPTTPTTTPFLSSSSPSMFA